MKTITTSIKEKRAEPQTEYFPCFEKLQPQWIVSSMFLRIYQSASALMHAGKEDYQLRN